MSLRPLEYSMELSLPRTGEGTGGMKRTPKAGGSLVEGNRRPSTSREALSPAQESPDQSRASIGLHRHEVKVVDHDPHWEVLYQAECERLREAVGSCVLDIQHVGSTAVPGLPAKPIIDIALGLQRLEDGYDLVPRLAAVGYQFMSEFDIPGELFFRRPEGDYHLHVLEMGSLYWTNYLLFRDYLSSD